MRILKMTSCSIDFQMKISFDVSQILRKTFIHKVPLLQTDALKLL